MRLPLIVSLAFFAACSSSPSGGDDGETADGSSGGAVGAGGMANNPSGGAMSDGSGAQGGSLSPGGDGGTSTAATGGQEGFEEPTVTLTLDNYASRKWARWPIPSSPSLSLPHPMSYTKTAEGIRDDVTGLVWHETTNSSTTNWEDALSYCEGLGDGWSLPTRIELTSIVNHAVSGPKVDTLVFSFGGGAGWTWASTPWVVNERKGLMGGNALSWFINFAVGDSNNSLSQTAPSAYSRCVQVPQSAELPVQHYAVTADEVTDQYTGLIWQRAHSSDAPSLTFEKALTYCEDLSLGEGEWRLPTLNEIASLVDDVPSGDVSPATDHEAFPLTAPDAQYWSQSPYGINPEEHWTLNFEDGFTAHRAHDTLGIARCVR